MHAQASGIKLDKLPSSLQSKMFDAARREDISSSRFENEYSQLLKDIGFSHEREVSPCDDNNYGNMLTIDCACKRKRVAIENDGASHFLTELKKGALPNHGKKDGPTIAKKRLLKRLGWKVINIPYMINIEIERKGGDKAQEVKKKY